MALTCRADTAKGERLNGGDDPLAASVAVSDRWRLETKSPARIILTTRYTIVTPKGKLTTVIQKNEHTHWVTEHLVKEKKDIDLIGEFATSPLCDVESVNRQVERVR